MLVSLDCWSFPAEGISSGSPDQRFVPHRRERHEIAKGTAVRACVEQLCHPLKSLSVGRGELAPRAQNLLDETERLGPDHLVGWKHRRNGRERSLLIDQ